MPKQQPKQQPTPTLALLELIDKACVDPTSEIRSRLSYEERVKLALDITEMVFRDWGLVPSAALKKVS